MTIPEPLAHAYAAWAWTRAWDNENGTVTWRVESTSGETRFVKIAPPGVYPALLDELPRMFWAKPWLPVPRVLGSGELDDGRAWLVTSALPGDDATREPHISDPARTVPILARGLRRFHDDAPLDACPFFGRLDEALALAKHRVASGAIVPARHFHPEHAELTPEAALDRLVRTRPASEDLVVCHGDYCFPNALIERDEVVGFVDLGHLGVADRWWDLAVGSWSTTWNVGPGWEGAFLDAYGVAPDRERIAFYRLLYDLIA